MVFWKSLSHLCAFICALDLGLAHCLQVAFMDRCFIMDRYGRSSFRILYREAFFIVF